MKSYEFWRERATGEVWAIELVEGVVGGCCGPLDQSEIEEQFLKTFDYSPRRAARSGSWRSRWPSDCLHGSGHPVSSSRYRPLPDPVRPERLRRSDSTPCTRATDR